MNNFTLIIPTHNRHHYMARSMEYYKDLSAAVIYCDSSDLKYSGETPSNIEYLHMPNLKFAEKILKTTTLIKTNKIALCADDDFIIHDSLYKGEEFLNNNSAYSTVVGQYAGFNKDFDGIFSEMYKWRDSDRDINKDARNNARTFFSDYHQILWAMYRKDVVQYSFEVIVKSEFKNDNFIEISIGACACYKGGIKIFNNLWGVREENSEDHWATRHLPLSIIPKKILNEDFSNFKKNIDAITFDGYADIVMNSYLINQSEFTNSIRMNLKKIIPNAMKMKLKKYFSKKKVFKNPIKEKFSDQLIRVNNILSNNFS